MNELWSVFVAYRTVADTAAYDDLLKEAAPR